MHVKTQKNIQNMSQYHKATFIQNSLGKNSTRTHTLETDLLNLSNPEKSVVSAGKLFHMLTIRMLKKLRLLKVYQLSMYLS